MIRLAQIDYINCLPLDLPLAKSNEQQFQYIKGVPSEVNQLLRDAKADLGPISSFEFLTNQASYDQLPNISISSLEQADSVLFVSNKTIDNLLNDGDVINLTYQSATSVALLKILLVKKYGADLGKLEFNVFKELDSSMTNALIIGDQALALELDDYSIVLDLGAEWYEMTALPMVFAVWAISKQNSLSQEEKAWIEVSFPGFVKQGLGADLPEIIIKAFEKTGLTKSILKDYYRHLDYAFSERHQKSLDLYKKYLEELNLC